MFAQEARRAFLADALRTRYSVGGVAAQGNEDAIALAHLCRADACHFSGSQRLEDRRRLRGKLIGIPVTGRHDDGAASALFARRRSRQKIVRLVTGSLGRGEAAGGYELRQNCELLNELIVEDTPGLIGFEGLVPVGVSLLNRLTEEKWGGLTRWIMANPQFQLTCFRKKCRNSTERSLLSPVETLGSAWQRLRSS
jgi:hypothetical protein